VARGSSAKGKKRKNGSIYWQSADEAHLALASTGKPSFQLNARNMQGNGRQNETAIRMSERAIDLLSAWRQCMALVLPN
jgi:hypothetical protein